MTPDLWDDEGDEWEPLGCYVLLVAFVVIVLAGTWVLAVEVADLFG